MQNVLSASPGEISLMLGRCRAARDGSSPARLLPWTVHSTLVRWSSARLRGLRTAPGQPEQERLLLARVLVVTDREIC